MTVVDVKDLLAADVPHLSLCTVRDAELGQHLEEEVLGRAVRLQVVREERELLLAQLVRLAPHVLEVGRVHAEDAEADVRHLLWLLANLRLAVDFLHLALNLLPRAPDALLAHYRKNVFFA